MNVLAMIRNFFLVAINISSLWDFDYRGFLCFYKYLVPDRTRSLNFISFVEMILIIPFCIFLVPLGTKYL
jgi:hypothetical protein